MKNYEKIDYTVDVAPLIAEIDAQPHLWNKNPCRLSKYGPHGETDDMFLRYKDEQENIATGDWSNFGDPHIAVWYKQIDYLPACKKAVMDLFRHMGGEILGGVFLYRVPPGKKIKKHIDPGWHANRMTKFNVCIKSNDKAAFQYTGEKMIQKAGDVHCFINTVPHWVTNDGDTDHTILTVCMTFDDNVRVPWSPKGWTMDKALAARNRYIG